MPIELAEMTMSSKTPGNTPEVVAKVLTDLGYDVPVVETVTTQETPLEAAAATEAAETAATETAAAEEAAAAEVEETKRKSSNQRKREARERLQAEVTAANDKASRLEQEIAELRQSTTTQIEQIRNAPPKVEEPPLEAPTKPVRSDFVDADDPDDAYDDAKYKWRRDNEAYEQKLADKEKSKTDPPPAAPAAQPVAAASYSDEEVAKVDLKEIKDQTLRRFIENTQAVTQKHPGAYKAIADNVPNVNDAIIQAGHMFDEPARIALYLAKHPDESKRIKELTAGDVKANPKLLRIAQKELEKIELAAAEEDAAQAPPADGSLDTTETDDEVDPDNDPAAATIARQPQRTEVPPPAPPPPAAQAPPAQPKKHTPIEPVGARGAQSEKPYEQMTPAEQKELWNSPGGIEKIRKMKGQI